MAFQTFRDHQKKLLAVLAILAMFAFVVGDSVPRLLRNASWFGDNANPVVVELGGRAIRRSEFDRLRRDRTAANMFLSRLTGNPAFFGELTDRAMVDALILEREADALGIPRSTAMAKDWLLSLTGGRIAEKVGGVSEFDRLVKEAFGNELSPDGVLDAVARQVRIAEVQVLPGQPLVTPLDVYDAYRDQNELASSYAVAFPVAEFVAKVAEPSDSEIQSYYEQYKNRPADPEKGEPGFALPRRVTYEYLMVDGAALDKSIRAGLTDKDVRALYEERKEDFRLPALKRLPEELFANDPDNAINLKIKEATKGSAPIEPDAPRNTPYAELKPFLEDDLVQERVQQAIDELFEPIKESVLLKYADARYEYYDPEADGPKPAEEPKRPDLKAVAAGDPRLAYDATPPLSKTQATSYGQIGSATVGLAAHGQGRTFAEEAFDPKAPLFEPVEFVDAAGRRYLAWRVADDAPRTPTLDEVRDEVVAAWKAEQARPLAKKAAEEFAETVRKTGGGGKIRELAGGRPIQTTALQTRRLNDPIQGGSRPRPLAEIPAAGDELLDAVFGLGEAEVAVAPTADLSAYYVVTPNDRVRPKFDQFMTDRVRATFEALMGQFGPRSTFVTEVTQEARQRRLADWLAYLRTKAGLPTDWTPPDEAERAKAAAATG